MIFNYTNIGHEQLSDLDKKNVKCKYFTKDDFDNYKDAMEEKGITVTVVRNTTLKELEEDDEDVKKKEYLEINGAKYKIKKAKERWTYGYIPIDETRFIRIQRHLIPFIILFGSGILVGLLILLLALGGKGGGIFERPLPTPTPIPDIEMDDDAGDWDGTGNQGGNNSVAEQENTSIPGFSTFKATKDSCLIKLYNYPENTVNFVYTITKPISSEVAGTFNTLDEAQKFITKNTITYTNYLDEATKNYQLKDSNGNITDILVEYKAAEEGNKTEKTYKVYENKSEVIYFTKGIAPNQSIDWNAYESLGVGEHILQFRISTYDVTSNAACYGAIQDVKVTIVE